MNGETTYGLKNSCIEAYLGSEKGVKQINRWEVCQKRHNMNFSMPAFFLAFIWYFYKGAYKAGFAFLAAFIILPNLIGFAAGFPILSENAAAISEFSAAEQPLYTVSDFNRGIAKGTEEELKAYYQEAVDYEQLRAEAASALSQYLLVNNIAFMIVNIILRIVSASFFDYFYFKRVRYDILYEMAGIKSDSDDDIEKCLALSRSHHETKDRSRRTLLITVYIVYLIAEQVLRVFMQ